MNLKKHKNGIYYAHLHGSRPVNLRTSDKAEAQKLAKASKLEEIEFAARARLLTAEAVQRLTVGDKVDGNSAFERWSAYLALRGAAGTILTYSATVRQFLERFELLKSSIAAVTDTQVDHFVNGVDPVGLSTRSVRLAALQNFFRYAQAEGLCLKNPAQLLAVRKETLTFEQKEAKQRDVFTEQELIKLDQVEDPFWSQAIGLALNYGLRLGDVAKLETASVQSGRLVVWTDKHDKRIVLPLVEPIVCGEGRYVFPTQASTPINVLSQQFTRLCARVGVEGKSFHSLRHTFAVRRKELGDTVDQIRTKMGHSNVATTEIYLNH